MLNFIKNKAFKKPGSKDNHYNQDDFRNPVYNLKPLPPAPGNGERPYRNQNLSNYAVFNTTAPTLTRGDMKSLPEIKAKIINNDQAYIDKMKLMEEEYKPQPIEK